MGHGQMFLSEGLRPGGIKEKAKCAPGKAAMERRGHSAQQSPYEERASDRASAVLSWLHTAL